MAAMHVLSPANLFQTDAAAAGKARSPMVAHTVCGVWGEVTRFQVLMDSTFIRFISHKCIVHSEKFCLLGCHITVKM